MPRMLIAGLFGDWFWTAKPGVKRARSSNSLMLRSSRKRPNRWSARTGPRPDAARAAGRDDDVLAGLLGGGLLFGRLVGRLRVRGLRQRRRGGQKRQQAGSGNRARECIDDPPQDSPGGLPHDYDSYRKRVNLIWVKALVRPTAGAAGSRYSLLSACRKLAASQPSTTR